MSTTPKNKYRAPSAVGTPSPLSSGRRSSSRRASTCSGTRASPPRGTAAGARADGPRGLGGGRRGGGGRRLDHADGRAPGDPAAGHAREARHRQRLVEASVLRARRRPAGALLQRRGARGLDPARRRADRRVDGRAHRDRPPLDHRQLLEPADRPRLPRRDADADVRARGVEPVRGRAVDALPREGDGDGAAAALRGDERRSSREQSMPWNRTTTTTPTRAATRRTGSASLGRSRRRRWRPRWRRPRRRRAEAAAGRAAGRRRAVRPLGVASLLGADG